MNKSSLTPFVHAWPWRPVALAIAAVLVIMFLFSMPAWAGAQINGQFEFDLHPHGPEVLAGMVLHPLERAAEALRFSRDFMEQAPDDLTVYETFMTVPPEPPSVPPGV